MRPSPVTPTVPLDLDGVHHGHLRLPHSHDDSAWGAIMVPLTVIRNGEGPTAVFFGGSHGDEYEGPVALTRLARALDPHEVRGRVILVPTLNFPAFEAGRRTSPFDGGNMNRAFPGRPDGTPTEKIADFVTRHLLPAADLVLDIHSGGRTLNFLPFAAAHALEDAALEARAMAAAHAFGAPYTVRMREIDAAGMLDTTAERMGKVFVTTEIGGGGSATARSAGIAERGARNLLCHAGILDASPEDASTERIDMPDDGCFAFAPASGLFDPLRDLGEEVAEGEPLARIWPTGVTGAAPTEIAAPRGGIYLARHFPGLVRRGDCAAVIAARVS